MLCIHYFLLANTDFIALRVQTLIKAQIIVTARNCPLKPTDFLTRLKPELPHSAAAQLMPMRSLSKAV
jgi:hypothetical protein